MHAFCVNPTADALLINTFCDAWSTFTQPAPFSKPSLPLLLVCAVMVAVVALLVVRNRKATQQRNEFYDDSPAGMPAGQSGGAVLPFIYLRFTPHTTQDSFCAVRKWLVLTTPFFH